MDVNELSTISLDEEEMLQPLTAPTLKNLHSAEDSKIQDQLNTLRKSRSTSGANIAEELGLPEKLGSQDKVLVEVHLTGVNAQTAREIVEKSGATVRNQTSDELLEAWIPHSQLKV